MSAVDKRYGDGGAEVSVSRRDDRGDSDVIPGLPIELGAALGSEERTGVGSLGSSPAL